MPDRETEVQKAIQDVLDLIADMPEGHTPGVARPELEQVLSRLWIEGAIAGQEYGLARLRVLWRRNPGICGRLLSGQDPEDLAEELLFRDQLERRHARRAS
jgi:hypothetical protein